jgi:hypothetical protein
MDGERVRPAAELGDRHERLLVIVRELVERRVDGVGRGDDQERVAAGRRLRRALGPDDAPGAGAVVHDDLLAEALGELGGDEATDDVVAAPRREGNAQSHRLGRIGLRVREVGRGHPRRRRRSRRESCGSSSPSFPTVASSVPPPAHPLL